MNYIDKPIESTKHYFLFQDNTDRTPGMFDNHMGNIFAMPERYLAECPDGYHFPQVVIPEDREPRKFCYPETGSD